jgi:uncharacterized radical SAM protein YgiQ
MDFLPVSIEEMQARGWSDYDILVVTGDAYVDHPSFGAAVIARLIEREGYRVCILAQPDMAGHSLAALGRPRLAAFITAGNIDSMVSLYTAAKKRRSDDPYSPGGKAGARPARAAIAFTRMVKKACPGLPVILGGLEASLRRFAHYDYWDDAVRPSILMDSGADALVYGMGERATLEILGALRQDSLAAALPGIRGVCWVSGERPASGYIECAPYEKLADTLEYAKSARVQHREHDPFRGRGILQRHGEKYLVQNPPQPPLTTAELDSVAELPYVRDYHPSYKAKGGVPAIEEVRFSIIHNRGCFGGCHFCALAFHQGRYISVRSHDSIIREAKLITALDGFKGYIHDVGGPTANFRVPPCAKALSGMCMDKQCLAPAPCPSLYADHRDYLALLRKLRALPGVKKVFIRSGIRYDYLMLDRDDTFFRELCEYHVSGQLKVAPEHTVNRVLAHMGKPGHGVFQAFAEKYKRINKKLGKEQYLVPYLMSSHPGCEMADARALADYLKKEKINPQQVQDFYPTPGTLSACMYYTGLDPLTLKPVYVPKGAKEKAAQRALLQPLRPAERTVAASRRRGG